MQACSLCLAMSSRQCVLLCAAARGLDSVYVTCNYMQLHKKSVWRA